MPPRKGSSRIPKDRAGPFLKWAGGKSALSEKVVSLARAHPFNRYFEPFVGGGAVFFALAPGESHLSDSNPELVNVYNQVRSHVTQVMEGLARHKLSHSKRYYYATRANPPEDPVARAAWFLYLNRTCYNGLWRVNSKGGFNVPMGSYKNPRILDRERLIAASRALRHAKIVCADFEVALTRSNPRPKLGDIVYLDPPYVPISATSQFTAYTKEDFTEEDQRRLARVVHALVDRGVRVILSNSDTPLARGLFSDRDFTTEIVHMSRAISSVGTGRGKIPELLIYN